MRSLTEKYINPFTDFGFKRIFGEEPNKDLLIDFLNTLLKDQQGVIVDLTYLKSEQLGLTAIDRKAIFDIYCENEKGEKFIVEMQKAKQNFFKDRSVYYSTFPIQGQARKTPWNYELQAVYTIGILDFVFEENKSDIDKFRYEVKLQDINTNKTFYDKLTFIYFEMPKFKKTADQLESHYDKWLYVLKNLHKFERFPDVLKEEIFKRLFEVAEIGNFSEEEYLSYEDSIKYYRDLQNSFDTAHDEGMKKGIQEGIKKGHEEKAYEIALKLLSNGVDASTIAQSTGLSLKIIEDLGGNK